MRIYRDYPSHIDIHCRGIRKAGSEVIEALFNDKLENNGDVMLRNEPPAI